mmetsp:Transcript_45545/g.99022  ORF Transcript_45545/g.99022 Transcript_45545/m.99022 type:complete len:282 (-) Transcript_45545:164-1009(-)
MAAMTDAGLSQVASWTAAWSGSICPRFAAAALPIQMVTVERTVPQVINLSQGSLKPLDFAGRMSIVRRSIVPQFSLKFGQLACFRELKFFLDATSPSTRPLHAPIAWGITNVPAQSTIYALATASTFQHLGAPVPQAPGLSGFVRTKILPGIFWTFLREGFATGGGLALGPQVQAGINKATGNTLPVAVTKFGGGLLAGWACAFATMLPHNCALTAARMAQEGQRPNTVSCFRMLLSEQGLFRALTVNFQQRCAVIAVVVGCLNTADVLAHDHLSIASQFK